MRPAVPPVLVPGRDPEPRRARDARLDPRGRRARLRAHPRLRRRVRQPGAAGPVRRRRRRGRDRPAGRVAGTRTSSSTPRATARCCRCCTSTATRSPTRPSSRASPRPSSGALMEGYGHRPLFVSGDEPEAVHRALAAALEEALAEIRASRRRAQAAADAAGLADDRPAHAQGLDRAEGGRRPAGRGHVPLAPGAARRRPHDEPRAPRPARAVAALLPPRGALRRRRPRRGPRSSRSPRAGARRMGASPHANGGELLRDLRLPDFRDYAVDVPSPATGATSATRVLGPLARRGHPRATRQLPPLRPRRDRLQPPRRRVRGHRPRLEGRAPARRRPPRPRRPRHGGALRAPLPGLARGLPADRPPRPVQLLRGVHPHRRLDVQPAREVAEGHARHPLAAADRLAQLPAHARTSGARTTTASRTRTPASSTTCVNKKAEIVRVYLPPDANCLLSVADHCLRSPPLRQRDRGRQAAGARLPDDGRGDRPLHARPRHLGVGRLRGRRRASPTSCSPAPATSRRSRPSPPPRCCASTCPSCACAWSTSST